MACREDMRLRTARFRTPTNPDCRYSQTCVELEHSGFKFVNLWAKAQALAGKHCWPFMNPLHMARKEALHTQVIQQRLRLTVYLRQRLGWLFKHTCKRSKSLPQQALLRANAVCSPSQDTSDSSLETL